VPLTVTLEAIFPLVVVVTRCCSESCQMRSEAQKEIGGVSLVNLLETSVCVDLRSEGAHPGD
jgi:hypothetical protein